MVLAVHWQITASLDEVIDSQLNMKLSWLNRHKILTDELEVQIKD